VSISFVIYGEPSAQERFRFTQGGFTYKSKKQKAAEKVIYHQAIKYRPKKLITGPIVLNVCFYRSIPKSWGFKKKEIAQRRNILPTTKPDLSNYVKQIEDVLTGIFWKDDNCIVAYEKVMKYYSVTPRTEIEIYELF